MLNQGRIISLLPNWNFKSTKHITDNLILIQNTTTKKGNLSPFLMMAIQRTNQLFSVKTKITIKYTL